MRRDKKIKREKDIILALTLRELFLDGRVVQLRTGNCNSPNR
jgi:hypothetical protein